MINSRKVALALSAAIFAFMGAACADVPTPPAQTIRLEAAWTAPTSPFGFLDTVPGKPAVRALDAADRPVKDLRVVFVLYRPAMLSVSAAVTTGSDGFAELPVTWVTGNRVGEQRVVAFAPEGMSSEPVEFFVRLLAGPAVALTMSLPGGGALLDVGDTLIAALSYQDSVGNSVSAPASPSFVTSDSSVARVNSGGGVVAAGHGTAFIVATAAGLADTVAVGVRNPNEPNFALFVVPSVSSHSLEAAPGSIAFSADLDGGILTRTNLTNGSGAVVLVVPTAIWDLAYVSSRNELWASARGVERFYRIGLNPVAIIDSVELTHTFLRFDTAPVTGVAYGTGSSGKLTRVDPANLSTLTRTVLNGGELNSIAFSPDGAWILLTRRNPATLVKVHAGTLFLSDSVVLSGMAQAVEVDRTGNYVFVAASGALQVRRLGDLSLVTTIPQITDAFDIKAAPTGDAIVVTRLATPGRVWAFDPLTLDVFFVQSAITPRRIVVDEATGSFWMGTDASRLLHLQRQ